MYRSDVIQALRDLIRGDGVRRASHDLNYDGVDFSPLFTEMLESEGYIPTAVEDIQVEVGERVPAFTIEKGTAHFGWIFWEVFTPDRKRKVFGSEVKNDKGDWAIMLARRASVYACPNRKQLMDAERPSSM